MWKQAQEWELKWWGDCANTTHEEKKQMVYAPRMGLSVVPTPKTPYRISLDQQSVVDLGCSAISLLLKCENKGESYAVDPLMDEFPQWVRDRYSSVGIDPIAMKGEDLELQADEWWIYNVLQHTEDPAKIIDNALKSAKIIRLLEWIETGKNKGHPHSFTEEWFNFHLGGIGKVEKLNEHGCYGLAYYGVFRGQRYGQ